MPSIIAAGAIGAGALGAGASIIASSNASSAASNAAATNNALAQQIYNQNSGNLQPYMSAGDGANAKLNDLLVQGTTSAGGAPAGSTGSAAAPSYSAYLAANPDLAAEAQRVTSDGEFPSVAAYLQWHDANYGNENRPSYTDPTAAAPQTSPTQDASSGAPANLITNPTPPAARPDMTRPTVAAPDTSLASYQESPDFNFQQQRGMGALESSASLNGLLHSGSAVKSALDFSQNLALGDYNQWKASTLGQYNTDRSVSDADFNSDRGYANDTYDDDRNYAASRYDQNVNDLMGLSGQGLSAAGALAGQGTSYVGQVSGNNNSAASTSANAGLAASGQVNGLLSNAAYAYGRSSYGGSTAAPYTFNPPATGTLPSNTSLPTVPQITVSGY